MLCLSTSPLRSLSRGLRFAANAGCVAAGTLASCTENIASCPDAQHSRPRAVGFRAKLRQHGVEHGACHLIPMFRIIQLETEDVSCAFDDQAGSGGRGRGTFLSRHARHGIQENEVMSTGGVRPREKRPNPPPAPSSPARRSVLKKCKTISGWLALMDSDPGYFIWLVSFMDFHSGYLVWRPALEPLDNPFGPSLSPM
jgi:hypothetical protein